MALVAENVALLNRLKTAIVEGLIIAQRELSKIIKQVERIDMNR